MARGFFRNSPNERDYRAEALSRDPELSCALERLRGGPVYVIRNRVGGQVWHHSDEDTAWAGASGATQNIAYDPRCGEGAPASLIADSPLVERG